MPRDVVGLLLLAWAVFPSTPLGSSEGALEALVTWSDATVTADASTAPRALRPGDRLGEGEQVHLPDKTSASLLCSTDRRVDLRGQRSWHLTPRACADGHAMDAGLFRSLTLLAGRYATPRGKAARRRAVRSGQERAIMLSPRHGAVEVARPELAWRALHDADQPEAEYELILKGHRPSWRLPVSALTCVPDPRWGNLTVCSTPWPRDAPDLEPGQQHYWQVGFRSTLTARLRLAQDAVPFRRLSVEASARRQRVTAAWNEQPWHPAHRAVLEGNLLAGLDLLPEAVDAYRRAATHGEDAGLDPAGLTVTQADLLLRMHLVHLAGAVYEEALHMASRNAAAQSVQAAALGGLGECADRRMDYKAALQRWQRAATLYKAAGLTAEAAQAESRAEEARRKRPETSP